MPSVVRSWMMTAMFCLAALLNRPAQMANALAAAALLTLAVNPANLFDTGCQLSFLAVAALAWVAPPVRAWFQKPPDPLDALEESLEPWWRAAPRRAARSVLWSLVISAVVWLVTLPLVMLRFHLVSPIGILWNVPLIPLTSFALLMAGVTLVLSALWTPLSVPWAWLCTQSLRVTDWLVGWGMAQGWGHGFTIGPSAAWVLAFYALLTWAVVAASSPGSTRKWIWAVLAAWVVIPLAHAELVPRREPFEVVVLDVGHGLAVLIRTAPGRAVLYDCGQLHDPRVGRRRIAPALWAYGITRLDHVLISHADADHDNGLPDLLDRFRIGDVTLPVDFGGSGDAGVDRLLDAVRARGVPIRNIAAGDRLEFAPGLVGDVLHPPRHWLPGAPDNDRSLVLDLSYQGRHLLLTGDLAGSGLPELVAQPRRRIDAMLAPHHGGRTANPRWLYDWARPDLVLVSQHAPRPGTTDGLAHLAARGTPLLRTHQHGALRLRWTDQAILEDGFLDEGPLHESLWNRDMIQFSFSGWVVGLFGLAVGLVGCGVLAILEFGAWVLVRPGGRPGAIEPAPWEPMHVPARDGTILAGAWRSAPNATGRTVLLLHGFGEDRTALLGRAEAIVPRGWNVALIDARARGRSGGAWTTFGTREAEDLPVWLEALRERVGPGFRPVAWGRSMGAAIALRAGVHDGRLRALVLESPYADLRASVRAVLALKGLPPWLAGPLLWRAGRIIGGRWTNPARWIWRGRLKFRF